MLSLRPKQNIIRGDVAQRVMVALPVAAGQCSTPFVPSLLTTYTGRGRDEDVKEDRAVHGLRLPSSGAAAGPVELDKVEIPGEGTSLGVHFRDNRVAAR